MKYLKRPLLVAVFAIAFFNLSAQKDLLKRCWQKQVQPLEGHYLAFSFQEKVNELEHSFEPWQQTNYTAKGKIWLNATDFLKEDTLINGKRTYYSKTQLQKSELLFLDYGDNDLFPVTKELTLNQIIKAARYFPANLLNYAYAQNVKPGKHSNKEFEVYELILNETIVKLFIRRSEQILHKITTLHHDELFGDALTTISYSNFSHFEKLVFATRIDIQKLGGKIKDEVILHNPKIIKQASFLLTRPLDYKLKESARVVPEILATKHNDRIHFIELKHTDDRVMVVEFDDFLMVAEAPMNSENGELIIAETRKIAPRKPIRYFAFGHYHPHYLGGVRPFIHKGAKIICSKMDQEYLSYIAHAPHTLVPDSLHMQKRQLQVETVEDSFLITDGKYEMRIYWIGEKSQHTKDYLIYYFPKEKLLFEDDLVWIPKEGDVKKAGGRQSGLYHAIIELGLEVDTIVQSWPVGDYGVKTIIPFEDLEKSVKIGN